MAGLRYRLRAQAISHWARVALGDQPGAEEFLTSLALSLLDKVGPFARSVPPGLGVFIVVNALGAILDRQGHVVRGNRDPETGLRRHPVEELEERLARGEAITSPFGNTTLSLVVTNQRLRSDALRQLGRQVHTSMARAIQPFHTSHDGDVLYAVTTNEVDNAALSNVALGLLASELAWDAILASGPGHPLGYG